MKAIKMTRDCLLAGAEVNEGAVLAVGADVSLDDADMLVRHKLATEASEREVKAAHAKRERAAAAGQGAPPADA